MTTSTLRFSSEDPSTAIWNRTG